MDVQPCKTQRADRIHRWARLLPADLVEGATGSAPTVHQLQQHEEEALATVQAGIDALRRLIGELRSQIPPTNRPELWPPAQAQLLWDIEPLLRQQEGLVARVHEGIEAYRAPSGRVHARPHAACTEADVPLLARLLHAPCPDGMHGTLRDPVDIQVRHLHSIAAEPQRAPSSHKPRWPCNSTQDRWLPEPERWLHEWRVARTAAAGCQVPSSTRSLTGLRAHWELRTRSRRSPPATTHAGRCCTSL